jgi:hypothetical protein
MRQTKLPNSMEKSPSLEANRSSASQETPHISRNPKVRYRIHKGPPPVPIQSHTDLVHTSTSHFSKIHFNIIWQWDKTHFKKYCSEAL